MVSTRKKKQSNRRLLSQLKDFDKSNIIGNTMNNRRENAKLNESTGGQDLTVDILGSNSVHKKNLVNVRTLERRLKEKVDREMGNTVDTVEDEIQNALLTAIDSIIIPKIELAIGSINASSRPDATSVMADSESGEHIGYCLFLKTYPT